MKTIEVDSIREYDIAGSKNGKAPMCIYCFDLATHIVKGIIYIDKMDIPYMEPVCQKHVEVLKGNKIPKNEKIQTLIDTKVDSETNTQQNNKEQVMSKNTDVNGRRKADKTAKIVIKKGDIKTSPVKLQKTEKPVVKKEPRVSTSSVMIGMMKTGATIAQMVAGVKKALEVAEDKATYNVKWYLNKFTKEKSVTENKGVYKSK
jgi:hypothetical protein